MHFYFTFGSNNYYGNKFAYGDPETIRELETEKSTIAYCKRLLIYSQYTDCIFIGGRRLSLGRCYKLRGRK